MADGSRHFVDLPQTVLWLGRRDHLMNLPGAELTGFLTDHVTEAWIDFTFRGHSFAVNDQFGEYWFFVHDPTCPDDALEAVTAHCRKLLLPE
jgi:hypothetical protein